MAPESVVRRHRRDPRFSPSASCIATASVPQVTYNLQDERELAADGFEKLPENLLDLGFGDMFIWVKKINRNLETNVENEETILNELKAARKQLKEREDDPILLDKIKALKLRLEKVKQESDFRDEYKDDPCVLQCPVERRAVAATAIDAQGRPRYTDHADDPNFSLSFKPSAYCHGHVAAAPIRHLTLQYTGSSSPSSSRPSASRRSRAGSRILKTWT